MCWTAPVRTFQTRLVCPIQLSRFGLILKPLPQLSFYASYAKSFLPQTGDQFNTLNPAFQSLEPEAFRNLELGAKWDIPPGFSASAALFELTRSNTRVADPLNPGFFVLTGSSRVRGAEFALSGKITPQWQLSLAYTYQEGEIRTATSAAPAGRKLEKLPQSQMSLWTRYDLSPRFELERDIIAHRQIGRGIDPGEARQPHRIADGGKLARLVDHAQPQPKAR